MAEEEAGKKVTLKLLIDKKNDVVLFAEAGKDFVDFLFHILAMPVGTVIRLLGKKGMVGSLGNLYDSIETLNDTYFVQPSSCNFKDSLLKPKTPTYCGNTASADVPLLLPPDLTSSVDFELTLYRCQYYYDNCRNYVALSPSVTCPCCNVTMIHKAALAELTAHNKPADAAVSAKSGGTGGSGEVGGYVKGVVTYMVMEDLVVKPMSTISSIMLLNEFKVADLSCLEERVVDFGMDEGVALLKASLKSKSVLTDVFLAGKMKRTHQHQ